MVTDDSDLSGSKDKPDHSAVKDADSEYNNVKQSKFSKMQLVPKSEGRLVEDGKQKGDPSISKATITSPSDVIRPL